MAATTLAFPVRNDAGAAVRTYYVAFNKYDATAAPTTGDDDADGYIGGSIWIDRTNDKAYICVDNTTGAAVWYEIPGSGGGSPGGIDTEVQFNNAGAFGGATNVTYNGTNFSIGGGFAIVVSSGEIRTNQSTGGVSTPGTVQAKVPLYNMSGTLLGYIALYDDVT